MLFLWWAYSKLTADARCDFSEFAKVCKARGGRVTPAHFPARTCPFFFNHPELQLFKCTTRTESAKLT